MDPQVGIPGAGHFQFDGVGGFKITMVYGDAKRVAHECPLIAYDETEMVELIGIIPYLDFGAAWGA